MKSRRKKASSNSKAKGSKQSGALDEDASDSGSLNESPIDGDNRDREIIDGAQASLKDDAAHNENGPDINNQVPGAHVMSSGAGLVDVAYGSGVAARFSATSSFASAAAAAPSAEQEAGNRSSRPTAPTAAAELPTAPTAAALPSSVVQPLAALGAPSPGEGVPIHHGSASNITDQNLMRPPAVGNHVAGAGLLQGVPSLQHPLMGLMQPHQQQLLPGLQHLGPAASVAGAIPPFAAAAAAPALVPQSSPHVNLLQQLTATLGLNPASLHLVPGQDQAQARPVKLRCYC